MIPTKGNILIKRRKDVSVSDKNMNYFCARVEYQENQISCYRPDWKNITKKSINIIRNKATSIEDTLTIFLE